MLHFAKKSVNTRIRGFKIIMEGKKKLFRKRKLNNTVDDMMTVGTHGAKIQKTPGKSKIGKSDMQTEKEEATGLHKKSALMFEDGKRKSCLLFMNTNQTVAIQGKVQLQAIKGCVKILGYELWPDSKTYRLFSPSSSSILTLEEYSSKITKLNSSSHLDSNSKLAEVLNCQSTKLKKIALARTYKAASVLLLDKLSSTECDFITQYREYEDIFTTECEDTLEDPAQQVNKKMLSLGFTLLEADGGNTTYHQPQEWNEIFTDIKGETNPTVLICGGKGVGKSTFARTVINSLLSSCSEICYLECDVGQTELTPPVILSLNIVSSPLLGPPFTHLQWPTRACFYGDISPKDNPDMYINSISSLYRYYQDNLRDRPLVINTQGWVKGFGVPLLLDIIRITCPTHIVQINSSQATKNLPTITSEFLDMSPGWVKNTSGKEPKQKIGDLIFSLRQDSRTTGTGLQELIGDNHSSHPTVYQLAACMEEDVQTSASLRPADHRAMSTLAYFSQLLQQQLHPEKNLSLLHCTPYRVPWNQVAVHVKHTMVPNSQLLVSLNASIVGLAISPSSIIKENESSTGDLPKVIKKTPITDCVGLGIVRNIDPINKLFYILTPVPLSQLRQVNTLLKGNLEIPSVLLLKDCNPGGPYVSSEFSYDIKGAGPRKVRYNLQRKKFNSPAGRPDVSSSS